MDTAPAIPVATLVSLLGSPRYPLVLDVRHANSFDADPVLVPGALRRSPQAVAALGRSLPVHLPVVVYCSRGEAPCQEAAHALGLLGVDAYFLEGGIEAWKATGAPTISPHAEPGFPSDRATRWVTRERPKIDRIACPWLVRRFVDPFAEFLYVPPGQVLVVAERSHAVPYDIPDVRFSHEGALCSFDAFLREFQLRDPVLDELALIVRAADTGRLELAPQSAGLLALSLGLSVLHADDLQMLDAGMLLYDALYAWLRSARGETHNAKLFERV